MRITKELAKMMAGQILTNNAQEVSDAREAYCQAVTDVYKTQIPENVMELFGQYPKWVSITDSVRLEGHGFRHDVVSITESLPCQNDDSYVYLKMNAAIAAKLVKLKNRHAKLAEAYRILKSNTTNALISLGTYKRISENFPEAVQFLPKDNNLRVMINYDAIRKQIKTA